MGFPNAQRFPKLSQYYGQKKQKEAARKKKKMK